MHTSASAMRFLYSRIFSLKKTAESIDPKIGVKKLKTETGPTLLYFSSRFHNENAAEDSTAK